MKIAYCLNKQLNCETICRDIQSELNKLSSNQIDTSSLTLVVDFVQTLDGGDDHIKKLTYDPDCIS